MSDVTKPGWGECPPEDLPLRPVRPGVSEKTGDRLIKFGLCQPTRVGAWVLARAGAYEDRDKMQRGEAEVLACLDLLQWQAGGMDARAALARLPEDADLNWVKRSTKP